MAMTYGVQVVELIPERRIILSSAVGKTNVDEIKWLADTVISNVSRWENDGWAYMVDCSKMMPVTPAECMELISMTRRVAENGCGAIAFVEGSSTMLREQARTNTSRAETDLLEEHFATREEALNWLESVGF